jgi:TonB family protein
MFMSMPKLRRIEFTRRYWILAFALAFSVLPPISFCQDDATKVAPRTLRVGGGVKPPRAIHSPPPEYPKEARKERREGTVVIKLVVGANGLPRDISVDRPLSPDLDKAAMDAVKKWKFAPGTKDGEPVGVWIKVEVSFHL